MGYSTILEGQAAPTTPYPTATPTRFKAETSTASNLDPLAPELVEPALDLEPEPASPFSRLLFGFKETADFRETSGLGDIAGLKPSPRSL